MRRPTRLTSGLRLLPILAAIVLILAGAPPARADDIECFIGIQECFIRAAARESMWGAVFASLDCELAFVDCVRRAIIGR